MKRLLSWHFPLLLIIVHAFSVAAQADSKCEAAWQHPDNANVFTLTGGNDVVTAEVEVNDDIYNSGSIQIYVNLDDDSTDCKDGSLDFNAGCQIKYKFKGKDLTFTFNNKESPALKFDTTTAAHQASITISKTGISFRSEETASPGEIAEAKCWPSTKTLKLANYKAASDNCQPQLEFKQGYTLSKLDVDGEAKTCDVSGGPAPTQETKDTTTEKPGETTTTPVNPDETTTSADPDQSTPTVNPSDPTVDPLHTKTPVDPSAPTTPVDPNSPTTTVDPNASTTTVDQSPAPSTQAPTTTSEDDNLVIIIVCCVIAGVILLIIVGILVYCFCFGKKKDSEEKEAGEDKDAEAGAEAEAEAGAGAGAEAGAEAEAEGTQKSDAKDPEAADGPEAENTQKDSEKKGSEKKISDHTQSEGADNTQE